MHDAIEFEKRGIPATVVLTRIFRNPCEYQFKSKGMEGHPYIELPHPVSQFSPAEMREVTSRFIDDVVRQLTAQ